MSRVGTNINFGNQTFCPNVQTIFFTKGYTKSQQEWCITNLQHTILLLFML